MEGRSEELIVDPQRKKVEEDEKGGEEGKNVEQKNACFYVI